MPPGVHSRFFFCAQAIDELKVGVECQDENFVSVRRSLFELQRSLKSPAINNNVLLKHLETCIQSKVSLRPIASAPTRAHTQCFPAAP